MGGVVAHSHRICDQKVTGSSLSRVPLRSNLGQVIYLFTYLTYVPLSPISTTICHWSYSREVNRYTTRCNSPPPPIHVLAVQAGV